MYNKNVCLIPPCMLAPGLQAEAGRENCAWREPYLRLMLQYQIDMIPYICAEASFQGYHNGLSRKPHGIDFYRKLEGYEAHCRILGVKCAEEIHALHMGGYHFLAVLGIEHSPSCAVNYMYTHQGMKRMPGMFMAFLKSSMDEHEITIPFIGINKRYPEKSLNMLEKILKNR